MSLSRQCVFGRCGFHILAVLSLLCRLSGLSPFLGETDAETMNFIVNCNWDFDDTFEGLSEEAKDFVSRVAGQRRGTLSCLSPVIHSDGDCSSGCCGNQAVLGGAAEVNGPFVL